MNTKELIEWATEEIVSLEGIVADHPEAKQFQSALIRQKAIRARLEAAEKMAEALKFYTEEINFDFHIPENGTTPISIVELTANKQRDVSTMEKMGTRAVKAITEWENLN